MLWPALASSTSLAGCSTPPPPLPAPPAPQATTTASSAKPELARATPRADAGLIPRATLFGNPDRARPLLSPNGKRIGFLAPDKGVMNVWVGPADDPDAAKPVTHETKRGLRTWFFAHTNQHVLYLQDTGGDEDWHVHVVDLADGTVRDLTPLPKVAARIEAFSPNHPNELVIALNDRDPKNHDLYRVNLKTGEKKLLLKNEEGFAGYVIDHELRARLATRMLPDGGSELVDPTKPDAPLVKVGSDDALTTEPLGFDSSGKTLYLLDTRERDTAGLFALDPNGKQKPKLLAEGARADVDDVLMHPRTHLAQAAASTRERRSWQVIDPAVKADFEALKKLGDGEIDVLDRTLDDSRWLVGMRVSDGPIRYYLYDRKKAKTADAATAPARFLFSSLKALETLPLQKMTAVSIKSRDGKELVSYLTLPAAGQGGQGPKPMVLLVHGGPWFRDTWGYNAYHQWLASRGYAALSVNFRGSTGFGKSFVNAADREWAGTMHDDLIDAVKWAVDAKIADPARVAIMGGSYGGYATLVGLTFTPEQFACGVDIVGPSNLQTLLSSIPPYWAPIKSMFAKRIGDPETADGRRLLQERSPLSRIDRIRRPLLIGQGANDPRVKQAESDQIVRAMQAKGIAVTYVLYPDEGHGFNRPENRKSFNAVAETFLAQCLGGPYLPVGDDFKGSSISVPSGASEVYGLADALPRK
jgi:dipeptidyl aminopeptidase/acylaminoacyl peptidase